MVKICPECGESNSDENFWCKKCNHRLIEPIKSEETVFKEEEIKEEEKEFDTFNYNTKPVFNTTKNKEALFSMLKKPIEIILILAVIISCYFAFFSVDLDEFNWDRYGGYPWDENSLPWDDNELPWTEGLSLDNLKESWGGSHSFSDISDFGSDFWFEGENIKTNEGWTFRYGKVKEVSFEAIVLDYYVYNKDSIIYKPSEIISPVDIFFGHGDIVDNLGNYDYQVVQNFYRGIFFQVNGELQSQNYFKNHVTNTHIIPHSQSVLTILKTIQIGDVLTVTGSYVNVYGSHSSDSRTYTWETDTEIGNWNCEIVLIDSVTYS